MVSIGRNGYASKFPQRGENTKCRKCYLLTGYLDYFGVYLGGGAIVYQIISVGYRSKSR